MKHPKSFADFSFTTSNIIVLAALTTTTIRAMREAADPSIPEELLGALISAIPLVLYVCYKYRKYKKDFQKNPNAEEIDEIEMIQRALPNLAFFALGYLAARIFTWTKRQVSAHLKR